MLMKLSYKLMTTVPREKRNGMARRTSIKTRTSTEESDA